MSVISPTDTTCPVFIFAYEQYKNNSTVKQIDYEEFLEDYQRFWYLIKIFVIYRNSGEMNVRLVFNHLTILTNNFGIESAQILLRIALDKGDFDVIRYTLTILSYIGYIPDDKFMELIHQEYLLDTVPISTEFITYMEAHFNDTEDV